MLRLQVHSKQLSKTSNSYATVRATERTLSCRKMNLCSPLHQGDVRTINYCRTDNRRLDTFLQNLIPPQKDQEYKAASAHTPECTHAYTKTHIKYRHDKVNIGREILLRLGKSTAVLLEILTLTRGLSGIFTCFLCAVPYNEKT